LTVDHLDQPNLGNNRHCLVRECFQGLPNKCQVYPKVVVVASYKVAKLDGVVVVVVADLFFRGQLAVFDPENLVVLLVL
jgi:hypothetical protein